MSPTLDYILARERWWEGLQPPLLRQLNISKMKIRGVMAQKGDMLEYINKMQQEVFDILAEAKSLEDLKRINPKPGQVYRRYLDELDDTDVKELAVVSAI